MFGFALEKVLMVALIALGVAFAGFAIYHYPEVSMLKSSLSEANEKVGKLEIANSALKTANDAFAESTAKQSQKIADMESAQKVAALLAESEIKRARAETAVTKIKYDNLFNRPRTGDDCSDLRKLFDSYYQLRATEAP